MGKKSVPSRKRKRAHDQGKQMTWRLHTTTRADTSGLGEKLAKRPGKSSKSKTIFDDSRKPLLPGVAKPRECVHRPEIETLRLGHVTALRTLLSESCRKSGGVEPVGAFERWLARASLRSAKKKSVDPLIPSDSVLDLDLIQDLVRGKLSKSDAKALAKSLAQAAKLAASAVSKVASKPTKSTECTVTFNKHKWTHDYLPPRISPERNSKSRAPVRLKNLPKFLKLNVAHSEKLKKLYDRTECKSDFDQSVFCVLARYYALLGHGYQAALCGNAFDVLQKRLCVTFECFASPLNCRHELYCSVFPDIDAAFGSVGSFFDANAFNPTSGSFEANPPFFPKVMSAMARRIDVLLDRARGKEAPLSFVVIIPGWKETEAWTLLHKSPHKRAFWLIAKDDHGFCDGAQHMRRDRFISSVFDTGVFVLQNDAAAATWPATPAVEQEFRATMADAVPTPSAVARRLNAGRGNGDKDNDKRKKKKRKRSKKKSKNSS